MTLPVSDSILKASFHVVSLRIRFGPFEFEMQKTFLRNLASLRCQFHKETMLLSERKYICSILLFLPHDLTYFEHITIIHSVRSLQPANCSHCVHSELWTTTSSLISDSWSLPRLEIFIHFIALALIDSMSVTRCSRCKGSQLRNSQTGCKSSEKGPKYQLSSGTTHTHKR